MRKYLFALLLAPALALSASANFEAAPDSTDPGLIKQGTVPAKMLAARHEFLANNMRGALTLYREVLEVEPNNAQALYRTAECHYRLKRYDLAMEYLDKSLTVDAEVSKEKDFFRGEILHRLADLNGAIRSFEAYLATNPSKRSLEYELCNEYIAQCKYAQTMMGRSADVSIVNLGRSINSRFDDYAPSVTADGKLLVFTSRRSNTEGGEIDEGSDYKFFEDVFISKWNTEDNEWENAESLPGKVNTPAYDAVLSISPSGKEMFIYKNNAASAGDIFMSVVEKDNDWSDPVKLDKPVNSSYFESSVSITQDGKEMYFISERPGGLGQGDIWKSVKEGESWGKPVNLGNRINTPLDEKFVFIHPNGRTIFFSSIGHRTLGSYDIFMSELVDGVWGAPVNLGYPINTVNEESTFSLTADNKTLYVAAEYEDSYGERDIYSIDVSKYPIIAEGYDAVGFGTVMCKVTNQKGEPDKGVKVKVFNADSEAYITEGVTDKDGSLKLVLQKGNQYRIEFAGKSAVLEENVDIPAQAPEGFLREISITL